MTVSNLIVFKVVCRCCGKQRNPAEFVHGHVVGMCWRCYEWHAHALEIFADPRSLPKGCQECRRTYKELEHYSTTGDVKFGFHRKDGIYQVLGIACGCSRAYERKRLDMYGKTPYGFEKKLAA